MISAHDNMTNPFRLGAMLYPSYVSSLFMSYFMSFYVIVISWVGERESWGGYSNNQPFAARKGDKKETDSCGCGGKRSEIRWRSELSYHSIVTASVAVRCKG